MKKTARTRSLWLAGALAFIVGTRAQAQELVSNGGFESGLAGWTQADQLGSDGAFQAQTGTTSPVNGFATPAPPEGAFAAMTDAQGPGSHVLYQDIFVPSGTTTGVLAFDRYVNNQAAAFFAPETLDFAGVNNQQARADIMLPTADPFSVSPADILLNVFRTQPGDPLVSGYSTVTADVSPILAAHAGQTVRLRFAEVDNNLFLNFGVDRVSIVASPVIPEPGTLALLAPGLLTLAGAAGRRRRRPRAN